MADGTPVDTQRVLIVEDDEAHAELIRRGFEPEGGAYELVVARTIGEAQRLLRDATPALVITDLRLPDGDGAELIEPDREAATYPVVVMTSFGDQRVAVEAMRTGALDYVVKSEVTLAQMSYVAARALREWRHIVERRNAERALRRSEEHFRSLIENALDLILVIDAEGRLEYVSPAVRRTLGYAPSDLAGTSIFEILHPEDAAQGRAALGHVVAELGRSEAVVARFRAGDGEWRTFETMGRSQLAPDRRTIVVLNARDITERLRAEEARRDLEVQLRQAQRLETLGTLAGGIAHDFNNILQAVMGCAELARGKLPADSPAVRYLDRSLEVSRRGRDVVEQILQFSRRRSQKLRPLALEGVVHEIVKLLRATLPRGIVLRDRVEAAGIVIGDASQLHQVVMNLATNARQAVGDEGTIEIALERHDPERVPRPAALPPGDYFVLSVSDDGPGVPSELRERIFEPFFTTKGVGEGTGLGLAVAHGIVKGHQGAIACESEPGQGSRFRVFLARARRPGESVAIRDAPVSAAGGLRVLFVDADANVQFVGRSLLENLGHEVTTATSGAQAIELVARAPAGFDLAIVDDALSPGGSSRIVNELRQQRPDLPIVVAGSRGPSESPAGDPQTRFLRKPFEVADLAAAIAGALGRVATREAAPASGRHAAASPGREDGDSHA